MTKEETLARLLRLRNAAEASEADAARLRGDMERLSLGSAATIGGVCVLLTPEGGVSVTPKQEDPRMYGFDFSLLEFHGLLGWARKHFDDGGTIYAGTDPAIDLSAVAGAYMKGEREP